MDGELRRVVGAALGSTVVAERRVHGGDVAIAFEVSLADGQRVFAKTHAAPPPHFFSTEAAGLRWLGESDAVAVPTVLAVRDEAPAFLALSWIDEGRPATGTEAELGSQLAALHRSGAPAFGRQDRRTTGSRGLPNEPCTTWAEFYATQRLLPLARLAHDAEALDTSTIERLRTLAERLERFGPADQPPARLHGDLWAGNRLVGRGGRNWLIDPAAHGGHREFDLAMMRLFGGFGAECFAAYEDAFPLADGWRERVALHQIAPLVVHAIKFGGGYVRSATAAIASYA